MGDRVNANEKHEFELLLAGFKETVNKDIQIAIGKLQILIMSVLLTNIVMIGFPALYVFFSTTSTADRALSSAIDNQARLNSHATSINSNATRLSSIEQHLANRDGYKPPKEPAVPVN